MRGVAWMLGVVALAMAGAGGLEPAASVGVGVVGGALTLGAGLSALWVERALKARRQAARAWAASSWAVALGVAGVAWSSDELLSALALMTALLAAPVSVTLGASLRQSGTLEQRRWRRQALEASLAGLLLAALPPALWAAHRRHAALDLTYLRTTSLSPATVNALRALQEPLHVRLFMPTTSAVRLEVEPYLAALRQADGRHRVELLDLAAQPTLGHALGVTDNGVLTLTMADDEALPVEARRRRTRQVELGLELSQARGALRSLDSRVLRALREVSQGERRVYLVTQGGAMSVEALDGMERLTILHQLMTQVMRLSVRALPLSSLAAQGVPADADALVWAGPKEAVSAQALEALQRYLEGGGALWLALDPAGPKLRPEALQAPGSLKPLLEQLGLELTEAAVASTKAMAPLTRSRMDRLHLLHDEVREHPVTLGLTQGAGQLALLTLSGGALRERRDANANANANAQVQVQGLILTRPEAWLDEDGDLEPGPDELPGRRIVAAASQGPETPAGRWRAVVLADAQALSDEALSRSPGNAQLAQDALLWLLGAEQMAGLASQEEDVRVSVTQAEHRVWLIGGAALGPLLAWGIGAVLAWRRRRERDQEAER